ncbi:uncharacterized protein LOC114746138 [Neltuma alba]|uniref:uncharacterized protein LOC114746138 n=1 Tax=Neltuma alba TaxID=207710 RepID=UPI0010A394A3|nr:uncharacterized protein LOC114746138 [Prosopis alba]
MARRQTGSDFGRFALLILFLMGAISCLMVYLFIIVVFKPSSTINSSEQEWVEEDLGSKEEECCGGIEHLELWGDAVKWGTELRFNSSGDCCNACKAMCRGDDGPCICNSWVFCGDREACGHRFGECWLKRQKDVLSPERRDSGDLVMWTSGLVFGNREGIVGLETQYGNIRIRLLPDCSPLSVASFLELLALKHCAGCHFYRAESRGRFWHSDGNHQKHALFGPPFALIQGTFEAQGSVFRDIPKEFCPPIKRGSVAWVDSGPEFFISLANHNEWKKQYTVFGSVLSEDMAILEKISQLPTKPEVWSNISVSVLVKPVPIRLQRMNTKS